MNTKNEDINQNIRFSEQVYNPYAYPILEWEVTVENAIQARLESYDLVFAITHSIVFQGLPVTVALYKMYGRNYFADIYGKYDYLEVDAELSDDDDEIVKIETRINKKFITNEKADKAVQIFGQELLSILKDLKSIDKNKSNNGLIDMRIYRIQDYLEEMLHLLGESDFENMFPMMLELHLIQTYELVSHAVGEEELKIRA